MATDAPAHNPTVAELAVQLGIASAVVRRAAATRGVQLVDGRIPAAAVGKVRRAAYLTELTRLSEASGEYS